MSNFSEYEKIPQSFRSLNLSQKAFSELDKLRWVVTEKVHGANFSFIYEDKQLKFAKRKEPLAWTDDFFAFQTLVSRIEHRIMSLFEQLSRDIPAGKHIIYGELFGGAYPHPQVPATPHVQAIQTGVYYSPNIGFCAFDIAVERRNGRAQAKQYLDYQQSVVYFSTHQLLYAKPLFIGRINEALEFNTRINSTIPALLHLPTLANNLIEGIVVKPFQHPSPEIIELRPVIKIKNKEFDEKEEFHQAKKWSYSPENLSSNAEQLAFLVDELRHYITQNRLNSVLSKTGKLDSKNPARMDAIKHEFLRDILADFDDDNNQFISELADTQQQWLIDRSKAAIEDFLQKVLGE